MEQPWQDFVLTTPEDSHWQGKHGEHSEADDDTFGSFQRSDTLIAADEIDEDPVDLNIWISKGMPDWEQVWDPDC